MKIVCDREKLLAAFQTAALFAPSRSPKEILHQRQARRGQGRGHASAPPTWKSACASASKGSMSMPPAARSCPSFSSARSSAKTPIEKLRIDATSKGTIVRGERSEFKLPAGDPKSFPTSPSSRKRSTTSSPPACSARSSPAPSSPPTWKAAAMPWAACCSSWKPNKITAVGTDGRRLAKMEGPAEAVAGHKTGDTMTIIRTPSLRPIGRALADADDEVHLAARGNDVLLRTPRGHVLFAPGRRPLPALARCVPRPPRRRHDRHAPSARCSPPCGRPRSCSAPKAAASISRSTTAR